MSKREDYKRLIVFCLASLVVLARKGNWVLIAIYGLLFAMFAKLYGGLKVGYLKRIDVFYSLTLALLCTNVVEYLEITLINRWFLSVGPMIEMTMVQLVLIVSGFLDPDIFIPDYIVRVDCWSFTVTAIRGMI